MRAFAFWSVITVILCQNHVFAFRFHAAHNANHSAFHEILKRTHEHVERDDSEASRLFKRRQDLDILERLTEILSGGTGGLPKLPLGDDFVSRLHGDLDLLGRHKFVPPGPGDQRGPCIGLNSLANHGFIDHSGIVGFFEAFVAINAVLGMGPDLSLILAVMGTVWGGDPVSLRFSIGGPDRRVPPPLGGLLGVLGQPQGIDFTHNFVETDSSLTRRDLYETGNCWSLDIELFKELYYSVPRGENFTFENRAAWASHRFFKSIATNPDFYAGPYSLFIARNAAWLFSIRILSDWSSGTPVLTHDMLLTWYGVRETPHGLVAKQGWEQIPLHWKRIPIDYNLVTINLDLVQWAIWYPELASVGGNTGKVNSFAGVNLIDPLPAIGNLPNLLLGNHLICFALEIITTGAPSITNNLFSAIFDLVRVTVASLHCPQVGELTHGGVPIRAWLEKTYPGAKNGRWL